MGGGRGGGRGGQAPEPAAADDEIVGDPIGREGLLEDLAGEMIPYTPEQLIEIGNREYAWCEAEMKKASREMGFGDDWLKALDAVKNKYVPAGGQPAMIRDLALEAEAFLKAHDLVTVPPLASDIWRMQMMSPERQRVNPFFTGGETISVSYPTDTMTEDERLMSMRGNDVHVSRATVQHELIPGHHLQGFMAERSQHAPRAVRHAVLRRGLGALLGDRSVGPGLPALAGGSHRHAVVAHAPRRADHLLAELPPRALDAPAVHRLSRDPRGATSGSPRRARCAGRSTAATRRSTRRPTCWAACSCARSPGRRCPRSWRTAKAFADAVLWEGRMPIEVLRAVLTGRPLTRDYRAQWLFYGDVPAAK